MFGGGTLQILSRLFADLAMTLRGMNAQPFKGGPGDMQDPDFKRVVRFEESPRLPQGGKRVVREIGGHGCLLP